MMKKSFNLPDTVCDADDDGPGIFMDVPDSILCDIFISCCWGIC